MRSTLVKFLLIVLFVSYYVGGTAFTHTHHFRNYSITHSHPYLPGTGEEPHHNHTAIAFNTIQQLNELAFEPLVVSVLAAVSWLLLTIFVSSGSYPMVLRALHAPQLRAPPCL
ncbi:MAG: hypothetical protein RRZ65_02405 [Tannerellaceae bacterium]